MMAAVCTRANAKLAERGEPPLPRITPHSLRHTWCSVMFAIGEPLPNVLADGGWADPSLPLRIYAHSMRRDPDENARLKAPVEGNEMAPIGTGDRLRVRRAGPRGKPRNAKARS